MKYTRRHFKVHNFNIKLETAIFFQKYVVFSMFTFMLYWQVDPLEKLDHEVADILVDIAENFLESVSIFTF